MLKHSLMQAQVAILLGCIFIGSNCKLCADAPSFLTQPADRTVDAGSTASFSVSVAGDPSPALQWHLNSNDIFSATNWFLEITNCHPRNQGEYELVATNVFGAITSQVAVLTVVTSVPGFSRGPTNITRAMGRVVTLSVVATGKPPPALQWTFNETNLPGKTASTLTIPELTSSNVGTYTVIASNYVGVVESAPATLEMTPAPMYAGAVDISFGSIVGADGPILSLAREADRKIVVAGSFHHYDGVPRTGVARLNRDGSLDTTFDPGSGGDLYVRKVVLQKDGKVLIGGPFTSYNGMSRRGLVRLNPDGSLDEAFNLGNVAGPDVYDIALDSQDRVIAAGSSQGGVPRVVRLLPTGELDLRATGVGSNAFLNAISLQDDGRWILCGRFTHLAGIFRNGIARLTNGASDVSFGADALLEPSAGITSGVFEGIPYALRRHGAGILVGGSFTHAEGIPTDSLALLKQNGDADARFRVRMSGFNDGFGRGSVRALSADAEGKIVAAGAFVRVNDVQVNGIVRLNWDGTTDILMQFPLDLNGYIYDVSTDQEIMIAGGFSSVDGVTRRGIARLHGLPESPPSISVPPKNLTAVEGEDASLFVSANGGCGLQYQWFHDGLPIPGATNTSLVLPNVSSETTGKYNVVVSNSLGAASSDAAVIDVQSAAMRPGALVAAFQSLPGANSNAWCAAAQTDGKILVGGDFGSFHGASRSSLVRLHPDGSLDESFTSPMLVTSNTAKPGITAISVTHNQRIIVAGRFAAINGIARNGLARLNPDGSIDSAFEPKIVPAFSSIAALVVQPDGQAVVGGTRSSNIGGVSRIDGEGKEDLTFYARRYALGFIRTLRLQPDGRLLVGGNGLHTDGPSSPLLRLFADGTTDIGFQFFTNNSAHYVDAIGLQPDGKILVGGRFPNTPRECLIRVNPDGSLDSSLGTNAIRFRSASQTGPSPSVRAIAVTPENRILVGGYFHFFRDVGRGPLVRLLLDGQVDLEYAEHVRPAAGAVNVLEVLPDGSVFAAGDFTLNREPGAGRIVRLTGGPPTPLEWALRPTNMAARAGTSTFLAANAAGFPPAVYRWFWNGAPLSGQTNATLKFANTRQTNSGSYFVIASNALGSVTSTVAQLTVTPEPLYGGSVDLDFFPGVGANGPIHKIALQEDGRIIIGGAFTAYNQTPRVGVARLNADGTLDVTFISGLPMEQRTSWTIAALAVDSEGRVLAGGSYVGTNGLHGGLVRLHSDGSFDPNFSVQVSLPYQLNYSALAVLPEGRILAAGWMGLIRLLSDGSLDPEFNVVTNFGAIHSVVVDVLGKIYAAGAQVVRLNPDGSRDMTFGLNGNYSGTRSDLCVPPPQGTIGELMLDFYDMVLQQSSRLVVGGIFLGSPYPYLRRLNTNGSTDSSFQITSGPNAQVNALATDPYNRVLVGGCFTTFNGIGQNRLVLLDASGRVSTFFHPGGGANAFVRDIRVQPDGQIIATGDFTEFDGLPRARIARLNAGVTIDEPRFSGGFSVRVLGVRGREYVLESADNLSTGNWWTVDSEPGNGEPLTLADPSPATGGRFYRVRIQLPSAPSL